MTGAIPIAEPIGGGITPTGPAATAAPPPPPKKTALAEGPSPDSAGTVPNCTGAEDARAIGRRDAPAPAPIEAVPDSDGDGDDAGPKGETAAPPPAEIGGLGVGCGKADT
jgi:hypothetical protein